MAWVFAAAGATVVGYANEEVTRCVTEGRAPVIEPGLPEMLSRAEGRLSATSDYADALAMRKSALLLYLRQALR